MIDMNGRAALVVGATGGIGAATARLLAARGARLALGYHRSRERAEALREELAGGGHFAVAIPIEDSGAIRAAAREIGAAFGALDILVNAAGFTQPIAHADLDALTDELFDAILVSNVRGPFALVRAFRALLEASGAGVIVNISSISATSGSGSNIAYCASKGALDTMTLSLGRALGPAIRALVVSPGAVATDFVAGRGRAALEKIAAGTPLRTVVEAEDVAEAVVAAIGLRATTGARIVVDGGRSLV